MESESCICKLKALFLPFCCLLGGIPFSLARISSDFVCQRSLHASSTSICIHYLTNQQFAQELLQTFSTSIGEISLVPVTGGIFTVTILHATSSTSSEPVEVLLWDRKAEGGFPETKELKNRVRNIIDPSKDMGHIDRRLKKDKAELEALKDGKSDNALPVELEQNTVSELTEALERQQESCEDCK